MKDYKIKVANEAESKEAQELFFALGYKWLGEKHNTPLYTYSQYLYGFANADLGYGSDDMVFKDEECQEITLPQLRDLAKPQMTWQDALRAVADGKEVEALDSEDVWDSIALWELQHLKIAKGFRIKPQATFIKGGNYTKEELLKIAGEME